jgi:hypothetical protein
MATKRAMGSTMATATRVADTEESAGDSNCIVTATMVAGEEKGDGTGDKRAMVTATKRAMTTDGDNMGNGYGKQGGGRTTAATTMGTARRAQPLVL